MYDSKAFEPDTPRILKPLKVLEQWLYYSRFNASMGFESMVLVSQVL